jgi:hypothetical protein
LVNGDVAGTLPQQLSLILPSITGAGNFIAVNSGIDNNGTCSAAWDSTEPNNNNAMDIFNITISFRYIF